MKYLVTGASGFVAGHLIEAILKNEKDAEISAVDLVKPEFNFIDSSCRGSIRSFREDLMSLDSLTDIIESERPQYIVHLAAFSSVAYSWQRPIESFQNNLNIFLNLLEAVRKVDVKIRILSVGSSEQYGIVHEVDTPLLESSVPRPSSPYAVARIAQESMAIVYLKGFHMDIVMTRSFNHFGIRQDKRFVLSGFARQASDIKKGRQEPVITAGDLKIVRDFTDVRDVVRAYVSLLRKGRSGEIYNVCSGIGRNIGDCLNLLVNMADISCRVTTKEELIRPVDNPVIIGNNTKIETEIGWHPEIPFETGLRDLYKYWMEKND